jgi:phosphoribosylformylglycinamidine cyclo-ligase
MEIYLPQAYAQEVINISSSFGIDAQIIGFVEKSDNTELVIDSELGYFKY